MSDLSNEQFERFLRQRTPCVDEAEQAASDSNLRRLIDEECLREAMA